MPFLDKIKRLYNLKEMQLDVAYQEEVLLELETRLRKKLPTKFRDYYLTLGKNKAINYTHNRLLKPIEIGFSRDNYLMFYEENQGAVCWGIKKQDLKLENPPVWGNYGSKEVPNWQVETKSITAFFLLMAVYNGTLGGLKYHANQLEIIAPKVVQKIKENWTEQSEISWEKQKVYTNSFEEVISLSFDDKDVCTAIFIGTNHKERFDSLLETLDLDWSYVSYDDE